MMVGRAWSTTARSQRAARRAHQRLFAQTRSSRWCAFFTFQMHTLRPLPPILKGGRYACCTHIKQKERLGDQHRRTRRHQRADRYRAGRHQRTARNCQKQPRSRLGENPKRSAARGEGHKLWIEGTLELINILDDARKRLGSDQAFGTWLTDNGYGEDRITRHDRSALLNMALDLNVTREVLAQTHRRSWRHIWRGRSSTPVASVGNRQMTTKLRNSSGQFSATWRSSNRHRWATGRSQETTRRPKKGNGTKKPKEEWGKDLNDFISDGLLAANALIRIRNSILESSPDKQAELLKKVTSEWSDKIDLGTKAGAWIRDWANGSLEKEADALSQKGRVVRTPARASKQVQPEA